MSANENSTPDTEELTRAEAELVDEYFSRGVYGKWRPTDPGALRGWLAACQKGRVKRAIFRQLAHALTLTPAEVVGGLVEIARDCNPSDFFTEDHTGPDWDKLNEYGHLVKSLIRIETKTGVSWRVECYDRIKALETLARVYKLIGPEERPMDDNKLRADMQALVREYIERCARGMHPMEVSYREAVVTLSKGHPQFKQLLEEGDSIDVARATGQQTPVVENMTGEVLDSAEGTPYNSRDETPIAPLPPRLQIGPGNGYGSNGANGSNGTGPVGGGDAVDPGRGKAPGPSRKPRRKSDR